MKIILKFLLGAITGLALVHLIIVMPQVHRNFIRQYVGQKVVEIVKLDKNGKLLGGGTGFSIRGPSGKKYIMTNAHVCDAFKGSDTANIKLNSGETLQRKILQLSPLTDLCLIEGVDSLGTLELGKSIYIGETIMIVGHPLLMPLAVTEGDIIDTRIQEIGLGIIGIDVQESECHQPKNKIVNQEFGFFGVLPVCMEEIMSYQTTAVSLPGSSGSPVVNTLGQVIGVNFAGDGMVHWGLSVPLQDIKTFLADR